MKVGALVLAAGRGSRMGAANKLTAEIAGTPVVARVVDAIAAAGLPPPLVVTGDRAAEVRAALAGRDAVFVTAADYKAGQAASLRAGMAAVPPDWDAVLVLLGDMPLVRPETIAALAAHPSPDIVMPRHDGRRGNPVRWPRRHFDALASLTGDTGGRPLLAQHPVAFVDVSDPGIHLDIDTPGALDAVRAALPARR